MDTTGIPVVKLHRARHCKGFERKTEVNYGYCAAKKSYYYGEKLTLFTTPEGIPTHHLLTPANVHDVRAFKEHLRDTAPAIRKKVIIADRGYYDGELDMELQAYASELITPEKKRHQKRNTLRQKKLLKLRSGIARINEQLQDHMRIDETRARSQTGLEARIQSIITSFTFGIYINALHGRNMLSLKSLVT